MDLWQQTMIRLARSERVTALMQRHAGATALARRFVVVGGPEAAVATARRLRDRRGLSASLRNEDLVPATGLEPVTKGLRVPCSTN